MYGSTDHPSAPHKSVKSQLSALSGKVTFDQSAVLSEVNSYNYSVAKTPVGHLKCSTALSKECNICTLSVQFSCM